MRFYDALTNLIFYLPCGGESKFRSMCLNFANLAEGDRVLDLCCGTGTLTSLIARHIGPDGQVVGLDISEPVLKTARITARNLPATFLRVSAENLPFASSSFDKCFISFGLHHMPWQAWQNALSEVSRTLRTGGSLTIVDYNLPAGWFARLTTKAFVKLFEDKGAYQLLNSCLLEELQQAGLAIKRRVLIGKGTIQLLEIINP